MQGGAEAGEKEKTLMRRVREEGNTVLQGTTLGNLRVHKTKLKSGIKTPSMKEKDVYANDRTHFSEPQRTLRIPFLKMIKSDCGCLEKILHTAMEVDEEIKWPKAGKGNWRRIF